MTSRSLRSHQGWTLTLLFLAGVVNFLDRSSLSVANSTIRTEMHLTATQIGWLLTAFSLSYGLGQLPLIGILDRVGTRIVLGGGLVLWSGAQLLTGFVRGMPTFVTLRVMLGAGEAPFYPAGVRSVREWFSSTGRGRATAVMNTSQAIGLAISPPILSSLLVRIGWRNTFILLGLLGLVIALAWLSLHQPREASAFRDDSSGVIPMNPWRKLLRQKTMWGMMLGFGGINYTNWLYISWLPNYLQVARHLSLQKSGWMASIPFLFGATGMICSGTLTDVLANGRTSLATIHRRNIVGGMLVSAAGTFMVAHSKTQFAAIGWISIALFFIHFAGTSGWGYVQAVSPSSIVASVTAIQNCASFMIASAAPVITGWLLDRTHSFTISLIVCSGVTVLGAISYATLARPASPRSASALLKNS